MSEVPRATFIAYPDGDDKFSEAWLLSPANVVSLFPSGDAYCRLCDSYFTGSPSEQVAGHEGLVVEDLRRLRLRSRRASSLAVPAA